MADGNGILDNLRRSAMDGLEGGAVDAGVRNVVAKAHRKWVLFSVAGEVGLHRVHL